MRNSDPRGRPWRWVKRGTLGLLALLALAIVAAVFTTETHWGRELLRAQVEQRLASTFVGGATLGGVAGNPFGTLTLRDLAIHGPDRRPAITVKRLSVEVGILPLLSHQARVVAVQADGLDVDLRRDAHGDLVIQHLTRPGPPSSWSIDLPKVVIRHGHVRYDPGPGPKIGGQAEPMNLDGLSFDGWAKLPHGGPVDAGVKLSGTWRERAAAPLAVQTVVHSDKQGVTVPYLTGRAGDVSVIASALTVRPQPSAEAGGPRRAPVVAGVVFVDAAAAAVTRLVPTVRLPADLAVQVTAKPVPGQPWTDLTVIGRVDRAPIRFTGAADLDARHARGELVTGALDLGRLSRGKLAGSAAATATFDVRPGGPRALPVATARIVGWGQLAGASRTAIDVSLRSAGERARAVVHASGRSVEADLAARVHAVGDRLAIEGATLHATVADPARASGGKAPVHGALQVDLEARGALRPAPSVAVAGTIEGTDLRMQDLSVAALHVAVDAKQLPARPFGRAHVQLVDLVRRGMQLGELTVDASDRPDGKVAVALRSRPKQNPWLVDADAVVTPPADLGAGRFAIDLVRHRVRAGGGADWTGRTGHIDIGPERIAVRDLASTSAVGRLAIAASLQRAGRNRGDLAANVDATQLSLDNIVSTYRGKLDTHVVVTRHRGAWQGEVRLDGRGLALEASSPIVDAHVRAQLKAHRLTVAADTTSDLGRASLAIDAEAPAAVAEPAAWKRLRRSAIRRAELTLRGIEVRRAAELAGLPADDYAGRITGDLRITPDATGGRIEARDLLAPGLRGLAVTALLEVAQRARDQVNPRITVTAEGTGSVSGQADILMPDHVFDPAAWRQLGRGALRGASLRADNIVIDPGLLDRLGVKTELRGEAGVAINIGAAARTLQAVVDIGELRGKQIVQPLDIHLTAAMDDRATTSALSIATRGERLLDVQGRLAIALPQLIERRRAPEARATRLSATATMKSLEAARLLAVFGRSEVTGGKIDGKVEIAGTLAQPTAAARLIATGLTIPPGPHGKPVRTVDRLTVTGGWDGTAARVDIDGVESGGGTLRISAVAPPKHLQGGMAAIRAEKFDLVPVLAFVPGPAGGLSGVLTADLRLAGLDLRTAQITGKLQLRDARIPTAPTIGTLRDASVDAFVADHEIQLAASGKLGDGSASIKGSIALDGAAPSGGKATIALRKVSPIGNIEPQITADVEGTMSRDRNLWRAELVVDHANVIVPKNRGEKLKPVGAPPDMRFDTGARALRPPAARKEPTVPVFIATVSLRSTHVESEEFRGLIKGRIEVRASGDAIALYGGIEADRGDLDLFGRRYFVERAGVHFDGPVDPLLDIRISHDFPDVTTVTEVRGRASKPELVLSSDPGTYSQGQLLGFLLGGEPGGDPKTGSMSSELAGAGESYVANQLGGYVKKALPIDIDVLRYEAATSTSGAAVTVGTWITRSLFLAYRQRLESRPDENTGEGEIEYWLSRRVVIAGTVGNRSYDGIDVLWRKRY